MPSHPGFSASASAIPASVYSAVTDRLRGYSGEVYPLHVGDTWMEPAVGCRMEDLHVADHPGLHRYTPPAGLPALREAVAARTIERSGVATEPADVLVSTGATAALAAVVGAVVDPGDEVLLMAPYWPLISGMVTAFGGRPVPVPLFAGKDLPSTAEQAVAAFAACLSSRTAAIYLNTPNNPSGRVLPQDWSETLVEWARRQGLWILSDEVYEPFVYCGEHFPLRPLAPERTVTIHSFSKAYGMTGNRCGYLVGPRELIREAGKIGTHIYYCASRAAQLAGLEALRSPAAESWVREAAGRYLELGRMAARTLGVPEPEGSTFLFLDVARCLDQRGLLGLLGDLADEGVLVAPGPSFGPYPTSIRVCFTCAEPPVVERGMRKLARLLA